MKVSLNWLKEYLDLSNITHEELHDKILFQINEIEEYKKLVDASNLMVGKVTECVMHPDSDHLHICQVMLKDGISQIVCGAPNVATGQKVIVALPGASLPIGLTIKATKVRGVTSNGMICSLQELGFDDKYIPEEFKNGIYVLDEDAIIGTCPLKYLHLDDYVIDLDLTANRSDLLSVEGIAYDLGAVLNKSIKPKEFIVKEENCENPLNVRIETNKCARYYTRYVTNVTIKESPWWVKSRLIASGIRPINNVVDVTNYVMLELGQPLHAFDADKLGNNIVVRLASEGEKLVTIDSKERILGPSDIVIANQTGALCVGGVMGGFSTEVTNDTKNVVLEAAYFDPLNIRQTSSRLGLKSESSMRFERKVDPNRLSRALDMAAIMLAELAAGTILKGTKGVEVVKPEIKKTKITTAVVNKVLGINLTDKEIEDIFNRLNYEYKKIDSEYVITIPSRRMDLEPSYQDIIEDIVRIYGYENIPTTLAANSSGKGLSEAQKKIRNIRNLFSSMGFNETITYSLVSESSLYNFTTKNEEKVALLMPMSEERAVMRQSLLNGLLEVIKYNGARRVTSGAYFEIGKKYTAGYESLLLSGVITGVFNKTLWQGYEQKVDFYVLKGVLDKLFTSLGYTASYEAAYLNENTHPGRSAIIKIGDINIGIIANIHPKYAYDNDLGDVYVFEIDLEQLLNIPNSPFVYETLVKYPTIVRDLAIVVKKDIEVSEVIRVIKQTAKKYLVDIELFDLYEGSNVNIDEKSLAFKLTFQDMERTLLANDVDKIISSVLNRLDFHLKAKLR